MNYAARRLWGYARSELLTSNMILYRDRTAIDTIEITKNHVLLVRRRVCERVAMVTLPPQVSQDEVN